MYNISFQQSNVTDNSLDWMKAYVMSVNIDLYTYFPNYFFDYSHDS